MAGAAPVPPGTAAPPRAARGIAPTPPRQTRGPFAPESPSTAPADRGGRPTELSEMRECRTRARRAYAGGGLVERGKILLLCHAVALLGGPVELEELRSAGCETPCTQRRHGTECRSSASWRCASPTRRLPRTWPCGAVAARAPWERAPNSALAGGGHGAAGRGGGAVSQALRVARPRRARRCGPGMAPQMRGLGRPHPLQALQCFATPEYFLHSRFLLENRCARAASINCTEPVQRLPLCPAACILFAHQGGLRALDALSAPAAR